MARSFTLRLPSSNSPESTLCKLCDIADWNCPNFLRLSGHIFQNDPGITVHHRKLWEFVQCVKALTYGDVLSPDSFGISVAAGQERLLFYLANQVRRIVAADIYGKGDFAGNEAQPSFFDSQKEFAPYPYQNEALKVVRLTAHDLTFPDDAFDFAICLSSIEHFGGLSQARKAIGEMVRVIRPGGIVFITTDCSLNLLTTNEIFRPKTLTRLWTGLPCSLVEPLNFSLSEVSLQHLIDMRSDDLSRLPHINLAIHGAVFTSVSIALRKHGPSNTLGSIGTADQLDAIIATLRSRPLHFKDHKSSWLRTRLRAIRYRIEEPFR